MRHEEFGSFKDRRRKERLEAREQLLLVDVPKRNLSNKKRAGAERICRRGAGRIVKEDLACYSYKLQKAHHLAENKTNICKKRLVIQFNVLFRINATLKQ